MLLVEIAEVTPLVGFNLLVLQAMTGKDNNLIAKGQFRFLCLIVCIIAITVFLQIVSILPDLVMEPEIKCQRYGP